LPDAGIAGCVHISRFCAFISSALTASQAGWRAVGVRASALQQERAWACWTGRRVGLGESMVGALVACQAAGRRNERVAAFSSSDGSGTQLRCTTQGRGELLKTGSRPRKKLNKQKATETATQTQITMDMACPPFGSGDPATRGGWLAIPAGQMTGRRMAGR
jgi:3-deoxy-D-arabino-heptulosonate 7-phosphate (DAHP) synthase